MISPIPCSCLASKDRNACFELGDLGVGVSAFARDHFRYHALPIAALLIEMTAQPCIPVGPQLLDLGDGRLALARRRYGSLRPLLLAPSFERVYCERVDVALARWSASRLHCAGLCHPPRAFDPKLQQQQVLPEGTDLGDAGSACAGSANLLVSIVGTPS